MKRWWLGLGLAAFVALAGWRIIKVESHPVDGFYQSAPIQITSSIVLDWTLDTNVTTYTIKRSLVHLGPYTTIATGVTGTEYVDSTVKPKTTYYYVISATNPVGTSSDSSEVSATTP